MLGPRNNFLLKDDFFMNMALLTAECSKDPSTQVGACLVSKKNRIISVGYNGFPRDIPSDVLPWDREGEYLETKYPYVVHAERNAIVNSDQNFSNLEGSKLYCSLYPCGDCAQLIIQAGIKEVIYFDDKYHDKDFSKVAAKLFVLSGIYCRQYSPTKKLALQ